MVRKIPSALEPAILEKHGKNNSSAQISAWLKADHGIDAAPRAIQRLLQRILEERAPIAQQVVRLELAGKMTADLQAVQGVLDGTTKDVERATMALDAKVKTKILHPGTMEWSRVMAAASAARGDLMRALELRFKLAGASGDGLQSFADLVLRAQRKREGKA